MRLSLGYQILLAILFGIFCGIFFGPLCTTIKPIGEIYIMLLQMVALPYICFSLIHGLGSISPEIGKKLFSKGWLFWVGLWTIMFVVIYFLDLLIPEPVTVFIGDAVQEQSSKLSKNFLTYLVPENPFYDLANNIVPAIAIFGLIVGVALMHIEMKEPLLSLLDRANQIIEKIFKWLALLSPIGVFSHIAVAAGTVHFKDLFAIEFYVVSFIAVTLFVTFWILPILLTNLTPLSYAEVYRAFRFVCLLPFATALPSIALPFINYYMKKMGEKHLPGDARFHATSQTVMPICYSFGQIGNCLILFFVLFLSFYYRHPFVGSEKGILTALTIPMSVGSAATSINAVSFLIQQLNFPEESVELFTETLALTLNFQVLLSIASVLTFIILVLYAYYGILEVKIRKLCLHLSLAFSVFIVALVGVKSCIHLNDNYTNLYLDLSVFDILPDPVKVKMVNSVAESTARSVENADAAAEPLDQILRTGVLKVGYDPENIPYCYWNHDDELAGYDIAFAYQLARDLDCDLELIPVKIPELSQELNAGDYDIAMSAIIMNEERLKDMDFTHPYTEQDNVLVVSLKDRSLYAHLDTVVETPGLKIGGIGGYQAVVKRHFPLADLVAAPQSADIEKGLLSGQANAWVWSHTPAFVWCLSHPEFVVAEYGGKIGKRYFAYPIRTGAVDWASFLNNWLILKEQSGFKERMRRYWIEGESPKERAPRWSIIRDVLHWVQ